MTIIEINTADSMKMSEAEETENRLFLLKGSC